MPSVIKINGRTYAASSDWRPGQVAGYAPPSANNVRRGLDADGRPLRADGTPIPPESHESPYRDGVPFEDEHDQVVYRVVHNLNVAEGWGTANFWQKRWSCSYRDVLHLAQVGLLDAAIETGTSLKRFRCRDEVVAREHLAQRTLAHARRIIEREEKEAPAAPLVEERVTKFAPNVPRRKVAFKKGKSSANRR